MRFSLRQYQRSNENVSAIKTIILIGKVFFIMRLSIGLIAGILFMLKFNDLSTVQFIELIIIGISLIFGSLTDLFLIYGAKTKKTMPIHFWNYAQFFVGGIICCILISITKDAIKEIEEFNDVVEITEADQCTSNRSKMLNIVYSLI
jgi:hypothetical protein